MVLAYFYTHNAISFCVFLVEGAVVYSATEYYSTNLAREHSCKQ